MSPSASPEIATLRAALLSWYDGAKRDLPWRRRSDDAYAVWVSEVMLQQTRVDTVLPYYERFLERFPTLGALAAASEDEVLAAWSGLGYYRRARFLHRGVREVVARYGGEVPRASEARLGLPGVGRYTAGALGSVCFGLEEPIVDGNVARILTRIFGIATPLPERATQQRLWSLAEQLVAGERPGDFNQAMMELGALVCSVKSPSCAHCPARPQCIAFDMDAQARLPNIPRKSPPREAALVAVVARRGSEVAMVRGEDALFGGLYGLPMAALDDPRQASASGLRASAAEALRSAGVSARLREEPLGEVQHVLSHRRLRVVVFAASHARIGPSGGARFFNLVAMGAGEETAAAASERAEVGIAKLTRKVLALEAPQASPRQSRRAQTR